MLANVPYFQPLFTTIAAALLPGDRQDSSQLLELPPQYSQPFCLSCQHTHRYSIILLASTSQQLASLHELTVMCAYPPRPLCSTLVCIQLCPSFVVLECLCMQRHKHCGDKSLSAFTQQLQAAWASWGTDAARVAVLSRQTSLQ